jgi:DNA recombination protein RmuC
LRLDEERELLGEAERRLGDTFKALAAEALAANNQGFKALAREKLHGARQEGEAAMEARHKAIEGLMAPVKESLDKVDGKIQELERERAEAYGRLMQQVSGLQAAQERLENQTGNLARALRSPNVRGRWGEIQLRRAVELAGMLEHCDFGQQVTLVGQSDPSRRLRPDMIVRLPAGRQVVVDAKVPLEGYLQAMEANSDEDRRTRMREHGAQVRAHLQKLSSKAYWSELEGTPEFVVMFLPGEGIFSAALEQAPGLLEEGAGRRVLMATPTTLIALLQTVHYGWKQEKLAENAEKISEQGRALHERVATLVEHWSRLGLALGKATEHFNAAAASFEGRVLPAARRLEELGAGSKKSIDELPRLDLRPRRHVAGAGGGTLPLPELVE